MAFGGPTDETTATRIVAAAEDAGVNVIDTADAYDIGRSQDIGGRAIARDRERRVLDTPGCTDSAYLRRVVSRINTTKATA